MRKQSSSRLLIYGILTGIVGFIPGLSVGTMMVVLGLYQQTIHSVSALRREPPPGGPPPPVGNQPPAGRRPPRAP